jgi:glycosyltransferase involved in cell wall biosynthesis
MTLRVVVLNDHGYVSGGAAQVAIASLNALADSGCQVTFVSSVGPVDKSIDRKRVKVINFGGYDLLGNPSRLAAAVHGIWDFQHAKLLGNILAEHDPRDTVVHLHTWVKSLSSSVVRETLRRGFRLVCTLHDYFAACPNGGYYDYQKWAPCRLRPMSVPCMVRHCDVRSYPQKAWRVMRQLVQMQLGGIPRGIRHYITVSNFSEQLLRQWLPQRAHIYRVRNPINILHAEPADPASQKGFLFVGRLSTEKGGQIFARAAAEANVEARFVGSGESEAVWRKENAHATFLGWMNKDGVARAMKSSRALVFPSLLYETQGLAVLEAAALGVPAIVSNSGAASDAVVDGETGVLFRAGDVSDLAEKLRFLENNPGIAQRLGKEAYERYWKDPCTLDRHVLELLACYHAILAE